MTDREKAIIMAFTGVTMLTGKKFSIFHKYIEDLLGRPVQTIELAFKEQEIKEKAKADFLNLCASEDPERWIPVSERVPKKGVDVLATTLWGAITIAEMFSANDWLIHEGATNDGADDIVAWMPLPEPYREVEE